MLLLPKTPTIAHFKSHGYLATPKSKLVDWFLTILTFFSCYCQFVENRVVPSNALNGIFFLSQFHNDLINSFV